MFEITKDNLNYGRNVDKCYKKTKKSVINGITTESKTLMYLFGAFFIFAIANLTLIYNFFKLLSKIG